MRKKDARKGEKRYTQWFWEAIESEEFQARLTQIAQLPDSEQYVQYAKLAEDYYLGFNLRSPLLHYLEGAPKQIIDEMLNYYDLCKINDDYEDLIDENDWHEDKHTLYHNYPLSIRISPLATKNDIHAFIDIRWGYIQEMIEKYRPEKKQIRPRPKDERNKFIYEQSKAGLSSTKINKLLEEKFPEEGGLDYDHLNKIIRQQKKRRMENK